MEFPNCNQQFPDSAKVCGHCGQRLRVPAPAPIVYPNCKAQNHPEVNYYEMCGAMLTNTAVPEPVKQPAPAFAPPPGNTVLHISR